MNAKMVQQPKGRGIPESVEHKRAVDLLAGGDMH